MPEGLRPACHGAPRAHVPVVSDLVHKKRIIWLVLKVAYIREFLVRIRSGLTAFAPGCTNAIRNHPVNTHLQVPQLKRQPHSFVLVFAEQGDDLVKLFTGDQQYLKVLVMIVDVLEDCCVAHVVDDEHSHVDRVIVQDPDGVFGVPGKEAVVFLAAQEIINLGLDLRVMVDEKQIHWLVLISMLSKKYVGR